MPTLKNKAFTLVEVLVVVTVIAILSSIAVMTYLSVQQDSRDASRNSNALIISEALEKYYESNGQYPSVASLANSDEDNTGDVIADKLKISINALKMPQMPSDVTNPITSDAEPHDDYISYTAQSATNNTACQNDPAAGCDRFTMKYEEESGDVQTINSRRGGTVIAVEDPEAPTEVTSPELSLRINEPDVVATANFTDLCGLALTEKYSFSYRTKGGNDSSWSGWTDTDWQEDVAYLIPGTQGTEYEVYVKARCDRDGVAGAESERSNTLSIRYPLAAPTAPSTAITQSGTNLVGTSEVVTCAAGATPQYSLRNRIDSAAYTSWSAWGTSRTQTRAGNLGDQYTFQSKARCYMANVHSEESVGAAKTIHSPIAPELTGTLTITAAMSGSNARATAGGGACTAWTDIQRQIRHRVNSGTWGSYQTISGTTRDVSATQPGYLHTFQQRARCANPPHSASDWKESGTDDVITEPASTTVSNSTSGNTTTWTSSAAVCGNGTTAQYQYRSQRSDGSWTAFGNISTSRTSTRDTSAQGYTYYRQYQVRCFNSNDTSPWSSWSNSSGYTRAPSAPTVTNSTSGSTTTWTSSAAFCPGTSAQYRYRSLQSGGSWSGYSGVTTSRTSTRNTSAQGYTYYRRYQARCHNSSTNVSSNWSAESSSSGYTRAVTAPSASALTISASRPNSSTARGTAGGGSCASGTTMVRQIRYAATNAAGTGTWQGYATVSSTRDVSASQGYKYTFQQRAQCQSPGGTNSSWVASGTASTVRPIGTPATPVVSSSVESRSGTLNDITTWAFAKSGGGAICPAGTTAEYQGAWRTNHSSPYSMGSWISWGVQTSSKPRWTTLDGHTYEVRGQVRCKTAHHTSGWSGLVSRSVYQAVAAPRSQANTPGSFRIKFDDSWKSYPGYPGMPYSRTITMNPPTCRPGAVPEYRWNGYMSNFAWPGVGWGWRYSPSTTLSSDTNREDPPGVFLSPSASVYPSNTVHILRVQYRCENQRFSGSSNWKFSGWGNVYTSGELTRSSPGPK